MEGIRKININKCFGGIMVLVMVVLIIGEYFGFQNAIMQRYKNNAMDRQTIEVIGQCIEEYERECGVEIKKVACYRDKRVNNRNPGIDVGGDTHGRVLITPWSDVASINYWLGTDFEKIENKEEYVELFAQHDWNRFSYDQMIFENDELHICMY